MNLDGWLKLHTDDIELKRPANLPYSGTFISPSAAIEESFSKLPLTLINLALEPISFFETGNTLLVHAQMAADNLRAETMHVFTITDSLVCKYQRFEDI